MNTKIAIVEDNAGIRQALEQVINATPGYECSCACHSGEEALRLLPRIGADVVLMDIHLQNRSGIECTRELHGLLPDLPIIMYTVYADAESIFQALQAGAKGYLLKRTPFPEVITAIQDVLQGGAPMTGEIARKVIESFSQAKQPCETRDLSRREREILELLSQGYGNKEIAANLSISFDTVRTHLKRIYEKLHVQGRTGAVAYYLRTK